MKASYLEQHGGPEVLKYGEQPDPVAGAGEILVDIVASSVNGADWKVRAGDYKLAKFPHILGREFSGKVAALGAGVTDFKVGDEVFAVMPAGQEGTYAEKVAVKADLVAKKPIQLISSRPSSPNVGTSGKAATRRGADSASARNLPDFTSSSDVGRLS